PCGTPSASRSPPRTRWNCARTSRNQAICRLRAVAPGRRRFRFRSPSHAEEEAMLPIQASRKGLYLGVVPERAAESSADTVITLDHDLAAVPEAGRQFTVAELAEYVDDMAGRLWAAGVRTGQHVTIYKSGGVDIT